MKCNFPRLSHKSSHTERWHGLRSISGGGQVSLPGTGSRAMIMLGLLGNLNP